jgi:imidazolonepropionase
MPDVVILHAGQLLTFACDPQKPSRGKSMDDVGFVTDGAVALDGGQISFVGRSSEAPKDAKQVIDASGKVVMPGFVDAHTHLVFAGSREEEFDLRIFRPQAAGSDNAMGNDNCRV